MGAKGCRHVRITGSGGRSEHELEHEYGTDDEDYYRILATGSATHGLHFDKGCSNIEINHVETHSNGHSGIVVWTYPRCGGN